MANNDFYTDLTVNGDLRVNASSNPNIQLYREDATTQLWELSVDSSGRLLFQEAASSGGTQYTRMTIDDPGNITLSAYGSGSFTGTSAYYIIADSSGNLIEKTPAEVRADIGAGTGSMTGFGVAAAVGGSSFTISQGETANFVGGTGITSVLSQLNESVTFNLDDTAVTAGSYTLASITVDAQGRITSASSGSGGGTMSSFEAAGDSGSAQAITNGNTLSILGGTKISTVASATDTITIGHDTTSRTDTSSSASPGSAGTFTAVDSVTTDTTGHITALNLKTVTMPTSPTVNNSSITINAGAGLSGSSTFTLNQASNQTVSLSLDISSLTLSTTAGDADLFAVSTTMGTDYKIAPGNINLSTFNNDSGWTSNTGSMSNWILAGDSGSTSIDPDDTATIAGGTNITTVESNGTVTINNGITNNNQLTNGAGYTTNTGTITGTGVNNRLAIWSGTSSIDSDSDFYVDGDTIFTTNLEASGTVTWSGGGSSESNSAYDNMITAFSDSGSSTITLTLTQQDGGTLTTSFSNPQGTITGAGANTQVAFFDGSATAIGSDNGLSYNKTTNTLIFNGDYGMKENGGGEFHLNADGSDIITKIYGFGQQGSMTFDENSIYTTASGFYVPSGYGISVGTTSTTSNTIRCTGNIIAYYSDERLKDFEGTIPNALDKVCQLNGYYYKQNKKAAELGFDNEERQVGVSAQEVEKIMPEVIEIAPISYDTDDEYLTVDYGKLVPLLIESIKELKNEIEVLKNKK